MTSQKSHAEKVYQARTKALRAPEPKLYRVSSETITHVEDTLVEATTPYQAIQKWMAARKPAMKLDAPEKAKTYTNESGKLEMQTYFRERRLGLHKAWSVWAVEAEVIR